MGSTLARLAVAGLLPLAASTPAGGSGPALAGEKLVYAIVHKGADYQALRTEIFSIDPVSGERQLVFSDQNTPIMLLQRLYVFHFPVIGGRSVFAHAAPKGETVAFPGNAYLYELPTDGTNSFRSIAFASGSESLGEVFADSAGARIGYINRLGRRQYIFIYDTATGKLAHQVDVTDIFLDCYASSAGWLSERDTLFFSLETGDVHITSEESYDLVGTYLMDLPGENLKRLKPLPALDGYLPPEDVRMIGALPTGEYVFETRQRPKTGSGGQGRSSFTIVKWRPGSDFVEDIGFSPEAKLYSGVQVEYELSPSGKYLAAAALPVSSSAVTWDIWLKDFHNGVETKLISISTQGMQGPFLGLVGWLDK